MSHSGLVGIRQRRLKRKRGFDKHKKKKGKKGFENKKCLPEVAVGTDEREEAPHSIPKQ